MASISFSNRPICCSSARCSAVRRSSELAVQTDEPHRTATSASARSSASSIAPDPKEYEKMIALLQKSSHWPELVDFSGTKLKDLLDTPEGRALQKKLADLIEQEEKWRVSLRKKQEEE